ncbi:single-stranded DNA-binding protein [Curtobacterium sp. MCBD17_040]|uniref:single-stranded DNA-binding protein n=1 Tax=Curtobacterium sp. MCBD17_040 TaxID=2175674 RepID=UPI000DA6E10B|nr:single-stranded DNA-binding protein [Curtobacterium sp. MCBD17_040]WIB65496.1 single-stranded DNA-binding protein [Curtobacterium sp. MCBD17_040]
MTAIPNITTIIGNLTADPEVRTVGGAQVANFSVASTGSKFNRDTNSYEDKESVFYRVAAWRKDAENVAASLHKGDRVVVIAEARPNSYEKDGVTINAVQYEAVEVAASLSFASAQLTRNARGQGQAARPASAPAPTSPAVAPQPAPAAPAPQPVAAAAPVASAGFDDDFS